MVCPFCFELGMAAANYELGALVRHIAKRHPLESVLVGVVGTALIIWGGPKIWRNLSA
jgi:hypothetical protein